MYARAGAVVLVVAASVLAWNELRNGWKDQYVVALDVPVQMSGVTTRRLTTGLTTQYDIAIKLRVDGEDPRVMCRIGYPMGVYGADDKHRCTRFPAVLYSRWAVRDAQRVMGEGHTEGKAQKFTTGGDAAVEAELGHFAGHAGRRQDLTVAFRRDARLLNFAHPRLVVQADWMSLDREFGTVWTLGALVLAGAGSFLVLIGAIREGIRRSRRSL